MVVEVLSAKRSGGKILIFIYCYLFEILRYREQNYEVATLCENISIE